MISLLSNHVSRHSEHVDNFKLDELLPLLVLPTVCIRQQSRIHGCSSLIFISIISYKVVYVTCTRTSLHLIFSFSNLSGGHAPGSRSDGPASLSVTSDTKLSNPLIVSWIRLWTPPIAVFFTLLCVSISRTVTHTDMLTDIAYTTTVVG